MATPILRGHNQGNLTLNAVTIGAELNDQQDVGISANDYIVNHEVTLSLRVHTAWMTDAHNQDDTVTLLDSMIEKLKKNIVLGEYKLITFSAASYRETFLESQTRGGEVRVIYHTVRNYQQE